jgi:hypothetical protein
VINQHQIDGGLDIRLRQLMLEQVKYCIPKPLSRSDHNFTNSHAYPIVDAECSGIYTTIAFKDYLSEMKVLGGDTVEIQNEIGT